MKFILNLYLYSGYFMMFFFFLGGGRGKSFFCCLAPNLWTCLVYICTCFWLVYPFMIFFFILLISYYLIGVHMGSSLRKNLLVHYLKEQFP